MSCCNNLPSEIDHWYEDDDDNWKSNKLKCINGELINIDNLPEECPYKLEHLISNA
jgi:hypothetical protein